MNATVLSVSLSPISERFLELYLTSQIYYNNNYNNFYTITGHSLSLSLSLDRLIDWHSCTALILHSSQFNRTFLLVTKLNFYSTRTETILLQINHSRFLCHPHRDPWINIAGFFLFFVVVVVGLVVYFCCSWSPELNFSANFHWFSPFLLLKRPLLKS